MKRSILHHFIRDAIQPYSEDFQILDRMNPVRFALNKKIYSAHISYIHDSGNARFNDDEVRIQIGRARIEEQRERKRAGDRVVFIGFFASGKAFVAWSPDYVFALRAKENGSVYARESQADLAIEKLAAIHSFTAKVLKKTTASIAMPSAALGFYLENAEYFHDLSSEEEIRGLLRSHPLAFKDGGIGANEKFKVTIKGQREKFTYSRKAYPRDPKFKSWILDAYGNACCVCGRQLGLIQAAHIIPHSEPNCPSPDTVKNGIALCVEHHKLYDDALLLPAPQKKLFFNEERAEYLMKIKQDQGLDDVRKFAKKGFKHPKAAEHWPSDEYLKEGLKIRMAK